MSQHSDIGASAEYHFAGELLSRGLIPNWPSTDAMPYDMIVDTRKARHRVQVKGTEKTGHTIDFAFSMRTGSGTRRYSKKDVDFIVLHLFEFNTWYIFPISVVRSGVRIKPFSKLCKWRKYQNAWGLLK